MYTHSKRVALFCTLAPWGRALVSTSPATREAGSGSASTQRQHSPGANEASATPQQHMMRGGIL